MNKFILKSDYKPTDDQKRAIESLYMNYVNKINNQVLLGVTGSGKTFTVANLIEKIQKPVLLISHNKTLAAQLYQEFKNFFPENAVSYFVSYYDYYQPEAYIPSTDTYIEKDSDINETIDKLRLAATTNLLTRPDTIVVASVSCIYNIGSPKEYGSFVLKLKIGEHTGRQYIIKRLVELQYERGDYGFRRGNFRAIGENIDIYPSYMDDGVRIYLQDDVIKNIKYINSITGEIIANKYLYNPEECVIYPAKHFIIDPDKNTEVFKTILRDLDERFRYFTGKNKLLEANRIKQKVTYDIQMIKELGYVKGIENYSRYLDGRSPGDSPYSLLDYYKEKYANNWLLFVDESHITFPQIRGMYNGDRSRKKTLIDYGFRLPSALDNRPLRFDEFTKKMPGFIATSATPSEWEISMAKESAIVNNRKKLKDSNPGIVEQLLRPTGIPDPEIIIKPIKNQIIDVIAQIKLNTRKKNNKKRTLVTTLTKKTAEDLTDYLISKNIKVAYIHSDVDTLERTDILDKLRRGDYDCIIGINLLREGLDLPEVSLVAILDADKEGFLRSKVSLIQTMGRAARNVDGKVILYADNITGSIKSAIDEVERRRKYQLEYNLKHNISPKSIDKPHRERIVEIEGLENGDKYSNIKYFHNIESLTPYDRKKMLIRMRKEMKNAAQDMNFELAIILRDQIKEISR